MTIEAPFDSGSLVTSYDEARQWIAYALRWSLDEVDSLNLDPSTVVAIGSALRRNRLLNPPKYKPVKVGEFICRQCGQVFMEEYRTKRFELCPRCRR